MADAFYAALHTVVVQFHGCSRGDVEATWHCWWGLLLWRWDAGVGVHEAAVDVWDRVSGVASDVSLESDGRCASRVLLSVTFGCVASMVKDVVCGCCCGTASVLSSCCAGCCGRALYSVFWVLYSMRPGLGLCLRGTLLVL